MLKTLVFAGSAAILAGCSTLGIQQHYYNLVVQNVDGEPETVATRLFLHECASKGEVYEYLNMVDYDEIRCEKMLQ